MSPWALVIGGNNTFTALIDMHYMPGTPGHLIIYDSVNNTVRLPKLTGIIEGTTDLNALGDLVEAGLPDHTHTLTVGANAGSSWPSTYKAAWGNDDQYRDANKSSATTNSASACNPIYGNSDTVQPQTIKALYYIVIL